MVDIAIIGSGQLGSRHLQGLAKIKSVSLTVDVLDTNLAALQNARNRLNEIEGSQINVRFIDQYSDLKLFYKIVIFASNSMFRAFSIREFSNYSNCQFAVLEKILFDTIEDYEIIKELFDQRGIIAWVNCPRRTLDCYKHIKTQLENSSEIIINVTGHNWEIACTSIHYLDLFSYLTNELDFDLDIEFFDNTIFESKRSGFVEFFGTMFAKISPSKRMLISCLGGMSKEIVITIEANNYRAIIKEGINIQLSEAKEISGWKWDVNYFNFHFQSDLTNLFVLDLIEFNDCDLTKFEDSIKIHLNLLRPLKDYLEQNIYKKGIDQIPIT